MDYYKNKLQKAELKKAESRLKLARTLISNAKKSLNIAFNAAETDSAKEEIGDLMDSAAGAMGILTGMPLHCRKLWLETVEIEEPGDPLEAPGNDDNPHPAP